MGAIAPMVGEGNVMSNPWLKKNPFMSMWLSGANRMLGTMRALATAQAKRQTSAAVTKATKAFSNMKAPTSPKAKPKRRR
jgi:hypothetical protein